MTTAELLRRLTATCDQSVLVESLVVDDEDEDLLSARIFLKDGSFLNTFYNLTTSKVAFAWIHNGKRIYGKDNTKIGWHVHPLENPAGHAPCNATDFETFLREIEKIKQPTQGN